MPPRHGDDRRGGPAYPSCRIQAKHRSRFGVGGVVEGLSGRSVLLLLRIGFEKDRPIAPLDHYAPAARLLDGLACFAGGHGVAKSAAWI